jgi:hypothetical protein
MGTGGRELGVGMSCVPTAVRLTQYTRMCLYILTSTGALEPVLWFQHGSTFPEACWPHAGAHDAQTPWSPQISLPAMLRSRRRASIADLMAALSDTGTGRLPNVSGDATWARLVLQFRIGADAARNRSACGIPPRRHLREEGPRTSSRRARLRNLKDDHLDDRLA